MLLLQWLRMEEPPKKIHWSTRLGLMLAIGGLLAMLGTALIFSEDRAAELGLGSFGMGVLHVATALCFLAGIVVWGWAVALEARPEFEPKEAAGLAAALSLVVMAAAAGVLVGSQVEAAPRDGRDPPARFAHRLNHLLAGLAGERETDLRNLVATKARKEQEAAAMRLSGLFWSKAAELEKVFASPEQRGARRQIAGALRSVAKIYSQLAAAMGDPSGSQRRVDRRRELVERAEHAVKGSVTALAGEGYVVTFSKNR